MTLSPRRIFAGRGRAIDRPTPAVLMIDLVALAAPDDLRVARDDADPGRLGRRPDRADDPVEDVRLEAFLEDEGERQEPRFRPRNDEIVDRAVDGQAPDVSPGEEERVDDVAVGREGDPPGKVDRVAELAEQGIAEGRHDPPGDEVPHEPAAAAELEADLGHGGPSSPGRTCSG